MWAKNKDQLLWLLIFETGFMYHIISMDWSSCFASRKSEANGRRERAWFRQAREEYRWRCRIAIVAPLLLLLLPPPPPLCRRCSCCCYSFCCLLLPLPMMLAAAAAETAQNWRQFWEDSLIFAPSRNRSEIRMICCLATDGSDFWASEMAEHSRNQRSIFSHISWSYCCKPLPRTYEVVLSSLLLRVFLFLSFAPSLFQCIISGLLACGCCAGRIQCAHMALHGRLSLLHCNVLPCLKFLWPQSLYLWWYDEESARIVL